MPKRRVSVSSDADFSAVSASASESDYDDVRRPTGKAAARKPTANSAPHARKARKALAPPKDPTTSGSTDSQALNCEGRHVFSADISETIAGSLLSWFDGVHASRGMPWRKRFNPSWNADERGQRAYEVWISEIMLQQTQVATVIPYYNKWMQKFPTLQDLARGSIDEVHALWKGLGYYSRASRLLEGAQKVMNTPELQGRLPGNAVAMQAEVPGVGRYSAGAICSIAYGEQVPVLDGNVNRLLSRVLGLYANPKAKATLDILWAGATALVMAAAARDTPGDLNQSLIELGSTVCKPKGPACNNCPIKTHCRAFKIQSAAARPSILDMMRSSSTSRPNAAETIVEDIEELCGLCAPLPYPPNVEAFPMRAEKKKAREEIDIVRVVEWRSGTAADQRWFLLVKRPDGGLLGGLEEFPTDPVVEESVEPTDPEGARTALENLLVDEVGDETAPRRNPNKATTNQKRDNQPSGGLRLVHIKEAGSVLHVFSHIRKTYRVAWVVLEGGQGPPKLLSSQVTPQQPPKKTPTVARATKRRRAAQASAPEEIIDVDADGSEQVTGEQLTRLRWVPLEQVRAANIGTGVVKIWDRVRTRWEDA